MQTAEELNQEAKLQIERQARGGKKDVASIEEYLKNFKWDTHKFPMDKSLKIIGTKILAQQKTCDEKLKKTMDEQNTIRNKLGLLQKKESASLLVKDLGDLVYEKKISKSLFVNTYDNSIWMTSVLVVVNKKLVDQFKTTYPNCLIEYYKQDFENWQKRTLNAVQASNQNIEDENQKKEIIQSEFNTLEKKHKKLMELPGVIPDSDKYLGHEDADGNQLWRLTTLKE